MTVILAIDPSTDITGVALVSFGPKGQMTLLACDSFDATEYYRIYIKGLRAMHKGTVNAARKDTADDARLRRIRFTRYAIAGFLTRLTDTFDAVAYETPNRNHNAVTAGNQAIGAYLSLSTFADMPLIPVNATKAKSVSIGSAGLFRAKGKTSADTNEKGRVVEWANQTLGTSLEGPTGEAISDACAIALAAYIGMTSPVAKKPKRRVSSPKTNGVAA